MQNLLKRGNKSSLVIDTLCDAFDGDSVVVA